MELLEKYKEEIKSDTKVDQLNILDKQMMLAANKHKWVARLIDAKKSLNKLNKKKKDIKKSVLEVLEGNMPKGLPKAALEVKLESSEKMQSINEQIEEVELVIDYLERVEKIFAAMSFDFTNMTNLIKMETT